MKLKLPKGPSLDLLASLLAGSACALLLPPERMALIDEMLITFLSIVLAAVLPGVALTASAARPPAATPLEASRFGDRLVGQVRFWLSFLWTGGLAVGAILAGRALGWQLAVPRPEATPEWVPFGGAWLVLLAMSAVALVAVRARHVLTAITSLINAGTAAHAAEVAERAARLQEEVQKEIASRTAEPNRGAPIEGRPRH